MTIDMPASMPGSWVATGERMLRELAAATMAGAMLGLVVGGIGGRAAMLVLARLNPEASGIVSDDGVDFTVLQPAWLGIAMFTAIPGVYAALLTLLAERWLGPESRFRAAPLWVALAPLLLWGPAVPLLGVVLVVLIAGEVARRTGPGSALLGHPAWPWVVRGALAALFLVALADLVRDTSALV